jgi:RNA polymerase sigma-70 factor, ECF subfamily
MTPSPDRDFYAEFVREHHSELRMFIRCLGATATGADDLAQEAFVIAWQKWSELRQPEDALKWLKGISYKLVVNERRKNARHKRILHDDLTEVLLKRASEKMEEEHNPTESLWDQHQTAFEHCLQQLPLHSKELLRWRYENQLSSQELAERRQVSPTALRQMLCRLRSKLKACIQQGSLS